MRRLGVLFTLVLTLTLAFTLLASAPADAAKTRRERKVAHGVRVAKNQIGDPYRYGAAGPNAFDCSGLTMFSYGKAGLYLPRSSDAQARYAHRIKRRNMQRGDLMFFYSGGGNVYHVGIYMGRYPNGRRKILHASYSGRPVQRDPVWTNKWYPGTLRRR